MKVRNRGSLKMKFGQRELIANFPKVEFHLTKKFSPAAP